MQPPDKVHFYNLDVLRCVCALSVAFSHSFIAYQTEFQLPGWVASQSAFAGYFSNFISNLSIGVDMFFVFSGFLITYLLLLEKHRMGTIHVGKFIIRRSLRIWPLYFFAIGFSFVMVQFFSNRPHPDYWANLLFLNNFHAIQINGWEFPFGHFWSICVEEHFYLIWPLLLYLVSIRRIPLLLFSLIALSMLFRFAVVWFHWQPVQMYLHVHTLARMDELLIGALCAWMYFRKPFVLHTHRWVRLLVYAVFLVGLFVENHLHWDSLLSAVLKKYFYIACIVFWMLNYLFHTRPFLNFKQKNVWHYLGKISFGIYVYHNILLEPFLFKVAKPLELSNVWLFHLGYFALVIGVAALSYHTIETYFLKFKDRFVIIPTSR